MRPISDLSLAQVSPCCKMLNSEGWVSWALHTFSEHKSITLFESKSPMQDLHGPSGSKCHYRDTFANMSGSTASSCAQELSWPKSRSLMIKNKYGSCNSSKSLIAFWNANWMVSRSTRSLTLHLWLEYRFYGSGRHSCYLGVMNPVW